MKDYKSFLLKYCKPKTKTVHLSYMVWQKIQFQIMKHYIENQDAIGDRWNDKYMKLANGTIEFDGPHGPVNFQLSR